MVPLAKADGGDEAVRFGRLGWRLRVGVSLAVSCDSRVAKETGLRCGISVIACVIVWLSDPLWAEEKKVVCGCHSA